jgi:hypothetical protein
MSVLTSTGSMLQKVTAVVAAATGAGLIVTLLPGFARESANDAAQTAKLTTATLAAAAKPAAQAAPAVPQNVQAAAPAREAKAECAQGWPYYQQSCLRDDRPARAVRVITAPAIVTADRAHPSHTRQTR